MDISERYIKMCAEAKELQENWKPIMGDLFKTDDSSLIKINRFPVSVTDGCFMISENNKCFTNAKYCIWLPRQDQLQEMIENKIDSSEQIPGLGRIVRFKQWCTSKRLNPATWEQLWLSYVMIEKYGKVWNGTRWFEIGD